MASYEKKNAVAYDEVAVGELERTVSDDSLTNVDCPYDHDQQRKIIHRIDRRLVLTCGLMYCISLMDRTNLGAAQIAGMGKALHLIKNRYAIITLVFFTTYVACQPPATVLCRKIGPRNFLSSIVVAWGALMIGFGFTKSYHQILALRVILGILEAGFFPGCVYLLSCWYSRYDLQKRYSVFYLVGSMSSALSGILAYGFMQMAGLHHLGGWSWIFIMEGVLTICIGFLGFFLLVDFPEKAHLSRGFLNKQECDFIIARVNKDRGDAVAEPFSIGAFLRPALDLKIWGFALIFACLTTVTYAIAYFLPIILRTGMGFSVGEAQCLVAPPYVMAGFLMYGTAWLGDRYHIRGPILVLNAVITLIGLPILGWAKSPGVRYFGVFLVVMGANSNIPTCMAYQANNIRGQWKRAFCSATLVGFGGIGGIAGSLIFRPQDSPLYRPGMYAAIASQLIIILTVGLLSIYFYFCNKAVREGRKVIERQEGFLYTI